MRCWKLRRHRQRPTTTDRRRMMTSRHGMKRPRASTAHPGKGRRKRDRRRTSGTITSRQCPGDLLLRNVIVYMKQRWLNATLDMRIPGVGAPNVRWQRMLGMLHVSGIKQTNLNYLDVAGDCLFMQWSIDRQRRHAAAGFSYFRSGARKTHRWAISLPSHVLRARNVLRCHLGFLRAGLSRRPPPRPAMVAR